MLKHYIRAACPLLILPIGLYLPAAIAEQEPTVWVGTARYRVEVTVDADARTGSNTPAGVYIDFGALLDENAIQGRVNPATIQVFRLITSGSPGQSDRDRGALVRHRLTGDFANDDAGMIWWRITGGDDRQFHIYFDTADHASEPRHNLPALVGVGDALHYNDGQTGFTGSIGLHSTYWHLDWDGDDLRDLIGFGLRTYEYGVEPEPELGNAVYFYKNIGAPGQPRFASPYRIRAHDGDYLRSEYVYQNFFPTDWDSDGDTDFIGFRGHTLHLFENTGIRDKNGLHLIKQPVPVMDLDVSEYRENDPNPLGQRYWAIRGARYADWDGDGDRDLIVTLRTVNQVGKVDSSKGVIPYGNGLQIFEVFVNQAEGPGDPPDFAKPFVIREERGLLISAFGPAPGGVEYVDWDSDGDMDLLFHDLTNQPLEGGQLMFCENIGTRDKPLFVMPIPILQVVDSPIVVDWNDDGRFDLISGGEFFENVNPQSGHSRNTEPPKPLGTYYPHPGRFPKLLSRGMAQQEDPVILTYFTIAVDWDGDGVLDLVSGYQSGVHFYRNTGSLLQPVFDRGVALQADDRPISLPNWLDPQADEPSHWGPQGPSEPRHGWSVPSVADWDGDGDLDMFVTAQRWQIQYFENIGTRTQPRLARGREVRCVGDPHEFSWRSKASIGDIDGDGRMELVVTSHQDNIFYAYEVSKVQQDNIVLELERGSPLKLQNGDPVHGWYGGQNNNGDNHSQLVDWDNDGDLDLLNGSLWGVWYYENVGSPTSPVFKAHGKFQAGGQVIHTFNHAGSFDASDWNGDGRLDLIVGAECPSDQPMGSRLYLFDRSYIEDDLPSATISTVQKRLGQ